MIKHLYILILTISCVTLKAQEKTLNADLGYFHMGDGDYSGVSYNNAVTFKKESRFFKAGIMYLNAATLEEDQWYHRHHVSNIINYYNLGITPILSKYLECSISLGFNWRYRNEITFHSSKTIYSNSGESTRIITNNYTQSYDYGGNLDIEIRYKTKKKIHPNVTLRYMSFNKGSSFYSLNLGINYTL